MYFNQFNYFLFILIIVIFFIYVYFHCNIRYVILSYSYNKDVILDVIYLLQIMTSQWRKHVVCEKISNRKKNKEEIKAGERQMSTTADPGKSRGTTTREYIST